MNGSVKSDISLKPSDYFEETDEMYYLMEAVVNKPQSLRLTMKLIYGLILEVIAPTSIKLYADMVNNINLSTFILRHLIGLIQNNRDKESIFINSAALSLDGFLNVICGNIDRAIMSWQGALEVIDSIEGSHNNDSLIEFSTVNWGNIVSALNYLKESKSADRIFKLHETDIRKFCESSINFRQELLRKTNRSQVEVIKCYERDIERANFFAQGKNAFCALGFLFNSDDNEFMVVRDFTNPRLDMYCFHDLGFTSIRSDLEAGIYNPIFEVGIKSIEKQQLRVRAIL